MYTSYVATILSSICMGYFSLTWLDLTWLDSISHVRVLLQAITTLHQKGFGHASVELRIVAPTTV